ncbi:MAG: TolC family protein [Comamonadaceae bacterium]|nr:TolC family protein [Comamonadaceae bacterium]
MASLAFTSLAHAQTLDFAAAYQAATSQDARLRAARHAADAGREALPQARSHLLPNLSLGVGRSKNALVTTTGTPAGRDLTTHEGYYAGNKTLSLRQQLYRPLLNANLDQARARVEEGEGHARRRDADAGRAGGRGVPSNC